MHRLRAALARGLDHPFDIEIAVARTRWPQQHGFVSHCDMHGVAVGLGINRNRAQPHGAGGTDHAAGDFTAVSDQERAKTPI